MSLGTHGVTLACMASRKKTPREKFIATTGRPPRTRDEYTQVHGEVPSWKSYPEDLRKKVKLNVRVHPRVLAQVKRLAKELLKTMEEVVVMALESLGRDLDLEKLEAQVLEDAARPSKSPRKG